MPCSRDTLTNADDLFHPDLDGTANPLLLTDADARIQGVNASFADNTGHSPAQVIGRTPHFLCLDPQARQRLDAAWQYARRTGQWRGEVPMEQAHGLPHGEHLTISAVHDAQGSVSGYVWQFAAQEDRVTARIQPEHMAYHDALTRLPNRVLFHERLRFDVAQARRARRLLAVCYLDLDNFKRLCDSRGRRVGERLLEMVARRLRECVRADDTIARLGGDEFALILNGFSRVEEIQPAISRILTKLAAPYALEQEQLALSASIGVSLFPIDDSQPDTLLRHADHAMHTAKQQGTSSYAFFDPENDRRVRQQQKSIERLTQALWNQEFTLHYQPKVRLSDGAVTGVEALIRWQHPEDGLIPPMDFLPLLEGSELAIKVGAWVIERATRQWAEWRARGRDLKIAVNVAGYHLQQHGFLDGVRRNLTASAMPAERLEIEILETAALEDLAATSATIGACMDLGIRFALDDFGTGYSSLTYLKRLPVGCLKIDQSFVRGMLADPEDLAIVSGVLGLARAFGRLAVAEGVETPAHLAQLKQLGCAEAQGYAIAPPLPAEQLPRWLEERDRSRRRAPTA